MDKLEMIFKMQAALDEEIILKRGLQNITQSEWIQKETLAIIGELSEVLDEVNYKWWKAPREIKSEALKEELADVLHFFISMCHKAGMDAEELFMIYSKKNQENFDRQRGISKKSGYAIE